MHGPNQPDCLFSSLPAGCWRHPTRIQDSNNETKAVTGQIAHMDILCDRSAELKGYRESRGYPTSNPDSAAADSCLHEVDVAGLQTGFSSHREPLGIAAPGSSI